MEAAARLPELTELEVSWYERNDLIPVGLFSNLSKLSITCPRNVHPSFISQMTTVIANSPHLRSLHVYYPHPPPNGAPRPTLSDLFAKVSTENPLRLEHLSILFMDTTVNQMTLPHLTHLTSFWLGVDDEDLSARVWASFLANNIKLYDVVLHCDYMTKEMMACLSSFSGLKKLVGSVGDMGYMLFAEVLPKHVDSLQTLHLLGWVNYPIILSLLLCP
jgi:hypothetical protein